MKTKPFLIFLPLFLFLNILIGQPTEKFIKVLVAPDHSDWIYKKGEPARFTVSVLKNGNYVPNVKVKYELGEEKMDPIKTESIIMTSGTQQINGGTLNKAGFLRLTAIAEVDGKEYRNLATIAFSPEEIKPTVQLPADFDAFWASALQDLAKIPMDAKMTLIPERCTEKTLVYHVNIQNNAPGARLYGILCVPKKEGKYPAILHVPGAGVRPYAGDIANAEKGIITLQIGIHGIPVNMEPGVYTDLVGGALKGYPSFNIQDKNRFYYKRVYLGCVRANDFLTSLPQYDGKNLVVTGGSQGGALSIVTAALDKRVQYLAALYPALSDVTGYLQNRAGGWPHYFDKNNKSAHDFPEVLQTVSYYDVVNFARRITVPGMYTWGFNDETCPPTSMYAAYNLISAPKELFLALETGHWTYPEQGEKLTGWLVSKIKN
ncbi:MAG: acetylxylan esterase [Bacteroidetes bacterium]|nr:acetylxylan esterase [Bacteroidota bacterium]